MTDWSIDYIGRALMPERQKLNERFRAMKASDGLLDMKFTLGKVSEASTEQVCREINRMLDAFELEEGRWDE